MMRLSPRQVDLKNIVRILESDDHETAMAMADALWHAISAAVQERGKFTVVGQLRYGGPGVGYLDAADARASKVCLGLFATEGDAHRAAESLFTNAATGEEWRTWVLPVEHKTPAEIYAERREARRKREAELKTGRSYDREEAPA